MENKRKAAFHNLGCKVNSYETDAMIQSFRENGYEIVPFLEGADVYIINTCTVTNIADRKSRQMLHKAKKMNKDAVVVAVGCYVQAALEELKKDEAIDILVGNNKKNEIVNIVNTYIDSLSTEILISAENKKSFYVDLMKENEFEEMSMTSVTEHTRAFIKIQDGCNQFCTYCIIPYSRGRIRSRKLEDLISEIRELSEKGYKEVVLTGIHLSSYGVDFKDGETDLLLAIKKVSEIDGIERIRIGSIEQGVITKEFVEETSKIEKFCPHFHLSLQSGCDETLKRMNRHYTSMEFKNKCDLIREYFKNPALTTDIIVGFPGETEEEFDKTNKFLEEIKFSEMHVFKYSKRKGTIAEKMKDQVNDQIKSERSDILLALNDYLSDEYKQKFIDETVSILVEEEVSIDGKTYQIGHTKEYIKVAFESLENHINSIVDVKVKSLLNKEILLAKM